MEYLEFDTEQHYNSSSEVSVIKYHGAPARFPHLASSNQRELRIIVLGASNLPLDCDGDHLKIKLTIIQDGESKPLKAKSELIRIDQENVR